VRRNAGEGRTSGGWRRSTTPFEVIQHLAWDDEIEVAGSVLANSSRLGTEVLVEIASKRGRITCSPFPAGPSCPPP
jgi:hypothetical protein